MRTVQVLSFPHKLGNVYMYGGVILRLYLLSTKIVVVLVKSDNTFGCLVPGKLVG